MWLLGSKYAGVTEELNLSLYLILIEITIVGSSYRLGQLVSAVGKPLMASAKVHGMTQRSLERRRRPDRELIQV